MKNEQEQKSALIGQLANRARRRKEGGADAARFLARYYNGVPPDDLFALDETQLVGGALSAWQLLHKRKPGTPEIRIFNPDRKADGFTSPHTVVEIVNDDMPFLVDSVTAELNRQNLAVHLVIHPVINVRRDKAGRLRTLLDNGIAEPDTIAESVMHLEITEQRRPETLDRLRDGLRSVLGDVRAAVADWRAMRVKLADIVAELDASPPAFPPADIDEARSFLRWLEDDNFTFLGYRECAFARSGERATVTVVPDTGLGVLRDAAQNVFAGWDDGGQLPPDIAAFALAPRLITVSKTNGRSRVHRAVHLDAIMVKRFDEAGAVVGERIFVGLFTSDVYHQPLRDIPMLSRKAHSVMARAGFAPVSHDGKKLLNILESLPRDDMFQYTEDELFNTALGVLHLQERQRVALFARRDPFQRFVSCLIFVPRERYTTQMREKMQTIVEEGFGGRVSVYYVHVSESALARLQFIIRTPQAEAAPYDLEEIERRLIEAGRDWRDELGHALIAAHGEAAGLEILDRYGNAFPASYCERSTAGDALADIVKVDMVLATGQIATDLHRRNGRADSRVRLKIYHPADPVPLSDVLPMLENMGLRVISEIAHRVARAGAGFVVWIHDFGMETRDGSPVDLAKVKGCFEELFARIWRGEVENDGFSALVLTTGLDWRRINVLRAYCKYLRQAAIPFSQAYMEQTLLANARVTQMLVDLFETLFDPAAEDAGRERRADRLRGRIEQALDSVENLDQDRILRRYLNVVLATLRTNYYQHTEDSRAKPYLSFKLDSRALDELPLPRPMVEIMVYSPRVEAIHLRGGKVARGGIRWSDRREDFRTEILGLMKAQMTKNAVIVPVGAKGGFVVKRPPADGGRDALLQEGIACYRTMMSGMLDLTDNLTPGGMVHPEAVVRRDGDDPYLVVAADKGTATFSDIANEVAHDYDFWLDDAFASGGSHGYDHKGMGITARGAWESVKRHFREMGIDIQTTDFTCVGIGDMSGDVFGNGMLLSEHIRLVGAFNHQHVFVDPNPDPAKCFAERRRLFALPRSSWSDYDAESISEGGGVFERSAKSIRITPEMRAVFELPARETVTPNDLIRAMIKAPVDLLWFGGIGTFVKDPDESHADTGDRVNDALRVDANELRCRVVGEGANLGLTQRGRIAYALAGGRINTDFIDNSAGVSTSDHEVNIKILLGEVMAAGKLTRKQRDKLLGEMTGELAQHVLIDNYRQSMVLTHAEAEGAALVGEAAHFIRTLERAGRLDRGVEFLPDDETLAERRAAGRGLTRPELAVLLAYAKMTLYADILASDIPDDRSLVDDVGLYFPGPVRTRYADYIPGHRLRREIIATYVTNSLINRVGPTFICELADKTGAATVEIAKAFLISRQIFGLRAVWAEIEALDNVVAADVQTRLNLEIKQLFRRSTVWFLRNGPRPLAVTRGVARFAQGIALLTERLDEWISADLTAEIEAEEAGYVAAGVPDALARRVASLPVLFSGCDIARIAAAGGFTVEDVARVYYEIGRRFSLDWLRHAAEALPVESDWQALATAAIIEDLYSEQSELAVRIMDAFGGGPGAEAAIEAWASANEERVHRAETVVGDLRATGGADIAMLTVANREIRSLTVR